MTMHKATPLSGGLDASGSAGIGPRQVLEHMRANSEEALEFQALMLKLQKQHSAFQIAITTKQEALKSMADIARESIRKSAER